MKLLVFLTILFSYSFAATCEDEGIEILGEVKFFQIDGDKRVKASKYFRLPASWNANSNVFYSIMIQSKKNIDKIQMKSIQCTGCKKQKETKSVFKVDSVGTNDYVAKDIQMNSVLNENFLYPGIVDLALFHQDKLICNHQIKLGRIK